MEVVCFYVYIDKITLTKTVINLNFPYICLAVGRSEFPHLINESNIFEIFECCMKTILTARTYCVLMAQSIIDRFVLLSTTEYLLILY